MALTTLQSDLSVAGSLTAKSMKLPNGTVDNIAVSSAAQIAATKSRTIIWGRYAEESATTSGSGNRVIHTARYTGVLKEIVAGCVVPCSGAATITIDLLKNGSTVLTAVFLLDSSNVARIVEAGITDAAKVDYAAGDVFELNIVSAAGGGTLGLGLFCQAQFDEKTQV